ncbi:MAG: hypothetical protein NT013_22755 [Planctomycetia bacterium]|nr:hypothetical protein [Planctomycetia bacterium]
MTDRRSPIAHRVMIAAVFCVWLTSSFAAEEPKKEKAKITFEEHVLPIFKARCVKCHAGAEPAQGLRLTTRRELLHGGKSGPAMRIAAAESSLLWEKLASNEMPKGSHPLVDQRRRGFDTRDGRRRERTPGARRSAAKRPLGVSSARSTAGTAGARK